MVPEAPDDLVVVGDGALMAALTRSRGERMRDIVATIQRHQDEAIRASARGITEITGGPGTGKTVVALHRAAYLLYSDRRRFESGGILVVGPSGAYTAYIERVLPSPRRGERDPARPRRRPRRRAHRAARLAGRRARSRARPASAGCSAPPPAAACRARRPSSAPWSPARRCASRPASSTACAPQVLRQHQRNTATAAAQDALGEAAWALARHHGRPRRQGEFLDKWEDHLDVEAFMQVWWPQVDPREVLLWLGGPRARAHATPAAPCATTRWSRWPPRSALALETGTWSVADVALVDDVAARVGPVQEAPKEERGFYEIEELEDLSQYGVTEVQPRRQRRRRDAGPAVVADRPAREAARRPHRQARRVRPRPRRRGPGPLAHAVADDRPPRAVCVVDRRR